MTAKREGRPVKLDGRPSVVLTDDEIPADALLFEGIECTQPYFSVGEVAKAFFAKSDHWLRWRERQGFLTFKGEQVGTLRTVSTGKQAGHRRYTLADVEKIAHALAEKGALDVRDVRRVLKAVRAVGEVWGYF